MTVARALTDSFAGIMPEDVGPFLIAQIAGASAAVMLFGWLAPIATGVAGEGAADPPLTEETEGP